MLISWLEIKLRVVLKELTTLTEQERSRLLYFIKEFADFYQNIPAQLRAELDEKFGNDQPLEKNIEVFKKIAQHCACIIAMPLLDRPATSYLSLFPMDIINYLTTLVYQNEPWLKPWVKPDEMKQIFQQSNLLINKIKMSAATTATQITANCHMNP